MSTNQEIWGSESDWIVRENYTGTNRTNMLLTGNFGDGYYIGSLLYQKGCLQTGYYRDKLPTYRQLQDGSSLIDEPLDNSISYCGLGNESVYSKLAYLEYKNSMLDGDFTKQDDRSVTNFAFCISQGSASGFSVNNDTSQTSTRWRGSECRISPLGYNAANDTLSHANKNREVEPYVSIPVRNFILTPVVLASNSINTTTPNSTSGMDIVSFAWWDYMDTNKAKNYTTHPYILMIGMHAYVSTDVDNIDAVTGVPQTARTSSTTSHATLSGVAVLSPLTVCDDEPMDIANPTQIIIDTYSYYLTRCKKATPASQGSSVPLFGFTHVGGNDTNYIRMPNSNGVSSSAERYVFFPHPNAQFVKVTNSNPNNYTQSGWYYLEYYDGLFEWVIQQIACFGLFFTFDKNTAQTGALNDPLMYLGVLDANGIGHGDYSTGTDNENQPQWEWDTTNNSSYKPDSHPDIDPNTYGVDSSFNPVSLADGALKRYVLDDASMELLNQYLWDVIDSTDPDELISNQTLTNFLTNNPLDCIVGIKRFPFSDMSQGGTTNIRLGKVTVPNTAAKPFDSDATTLTCGSKYVPRYFNDWRDYCCKFTLVLPFCGSIDLPPEIVVGQWITVNYSIDYTTGTCTAWILCTLSDGSNVVIDSASGNCSIDIPVSGVQTATLNSQIYNANENLKAQKFNDIVGGAQSAMKFISAVGSGEKLQSMAAGLDFGADVVNAIHSQKQAEWNINNTIIPTKLIGASSGCNSFQHELIPRLIIYKPIVDYGDNYNFNDEAFAHSVGLQCCESGTIGDYTGYIESTNVDLSGFNATATEKNMIQSALAGGVYL